jgi:hypothetical protein
MLQLPIARTTSASEAPRSVRPQPPIARAAPPVWRSTIPAASSSRNLAVSRVREIPGSASISSPKRSGFGCAKSSSRTASSVQRSPSRSRNRASGHQGWLYVRSASRAYSRAYCGGCGAGAPSFVNSGGS